MNNRWDGTLAGVQFRLVRGQGAYNRFFSRQQVEEQFVYPIEGRKSREDLNRFIQSSWSDGSTWWRPLIDENFRATYMYSTGVDAWSNPGVIKGINHPNANSSATRGMVNISSTLYSPMATAPFKGQRNTIVGVSSTTNNPIRYWNGSAWADSTQNTTLATPWDIAYSPGDDRVYIVSSSAIRWVNGGDSGSGSITGSWVPDYGTTLVPGVTGAMHLWDGTTLRRVDAAGTALEDVTDDGLGRCVLSQVDASGGLLEPYKFRLAVGTSEGIYYVKNTYQKGQPQPWVFRVERDAAGNIISTPIATLPTGRLALSIGFAAGTPMIITTNEWDAALENTTNYTTEVWSIFGGTLGLLGKIYARDPDDFSDETVTETVALFLGTDGDLVMFGSTGGVWGYDTIRGGLHKLYDSLPAHGAEHSYLHLEGEGLVQHGESTVANVRGTFDLPTSALGTDDDTMTLYSNWFDFNLPGEDKTITSVRTVTDETGNAATNQWRVYIIEDDGTVNDISHNHVNTQEQETASLSITSERFRYRLMYETTSASAKPAALTRVIVEAETGELVQGWQLTIDGTQFINVENEPQDPLDVFDSWVTLGQNSAVISFEDNFEAYDRSEKTTHTVKIQAVQIQKSEPGESTVQVTLIDA